MKEIVFARVKILSENHKFIPRGQTVRRLLHATLSTRYPVVLPSVVPFRIECLTSSEKNLKWREKFLEIAVKLLDQYRQANSFVGVAAIEKQVPQ